MSSEDRDSLLKLTQLRSAYKRDLSLDCIEKILQTKGDINFKIPDNEEYAGWTALHFAQRRDVIQLLMDYGADFTIKNYEEQTVLLRRLETIHFKYAHSDDWGLKEKLSDKIIDTILSAHVEKSMSMNPGDEDGLTHFHVACMADHTAAVQMFLDSGVPVDLAIDEDSSIFPGCTALQIATRSCAPKVFKMLLKCGADPYAKDGDGMTVMHWLINNSIKIVDSLIIEKVIRGRFTWTSKLKSNQEMMDLLINSFTSTDEIGLSQLHIACSIGDASVVEHFLSQETQIDHKVNADSCLWPGYTALHFAAHFDVNTVHILVERGANVMAESTNGTTPFDICLERYSTKDIYLVMSKQPIWKDITFLDGKTKLLDFISAMEDNEEYRCFLDENIDDINTSIVENSPLWPGFTPLHIAVMFSEQRKNTSNYAPTDEMFDAVFRFVKECLDRGAVITAADAFGCTPLHLAFRHQRTRTIAKLLKDYDGSVDPVDENMVSHLHIACASGNEKVVKNLLQSGADANLQVASDFKFYQIQESHYYRLYVVRVHAGSTPLHIAVANRHDEVVKLLVDNGADVNVTDVNGATPIHCSLLHEAEATGFGIINTLLSADLKAVTLRGAGITHLYVASYFNRVDAARILLDLGADVNARLGCQSQLNLFCERYYYGCCNLHSKCFSPEVTVLHNAVWRGSTKTARFLMSRGADLLTKNPRGESPLNYMIEKYDEGWIKMLAEVLRENEALARRVREDYGLTLIHLAIGEADPEAVKTLIDAGANVNAQMTEEAHGWAGYTPLHMIVKYSCRSEFFIELERSSDACIFDDLCVDDDIKKYVLQTIRVLLDAGADVSIYGASGNTPLHLIAKEILEQRDDEGFHEELLNIMLNSIKDFRVNPAGKGGMSHFHIACLQNNEMAIEKFLQHGVDVNAAIDFFNDQRAGDSALHLLAQKWLQPPLKVETIDALLAHGAEVDAQNADGDTVLHLLARFVPDRVDIFRGLFRAGADHTKLNKLCETPLALLLLSSEATPEVIQLFVERGCCVNQFNAEDQGFLVGPLCARLCVIENEINDRPRIFDILFESRNIAKLDSTGRTAIHNIVSVAGFRISKSVTVEEYSKLVASLCNVGCDIDSQDQSGKTALHLAAQLKNNKAIAALLLNGADVNVVDTSNKTAFTYGARTCKCKFISIIEHRHNDVIDTFLIHLRKMNHFKLDINNINRMIMSKWNVRPGFDAHGMQKFYLQVNQLSLYKYDDNSMSFNLIDLVSETGLVSVYPFKASIRLLIETFFKGIDVYLEDYSEIIGLIQMQIRKARKRVSLIDPAADSMSQVVGFPFPEVCRQIVLKYLSNSDLENLIFSTN